MRTLKPSREIGDKQFGDTLEEMIVLSEAEFTELF
jgi:hypothetical protein